MIRTGQRSPPTVRRGQKRKCCLTLFQSTCPIVTLSSSSLGPMISFRSSYVSCSLPDPSVLGLAEITRYFAWRSDTSVNDRCSEQYVHVQPGHFTSDDLRHGDCFSRTPSVHALILQHRTSTALLITSTELQYPWTLSTYAAADNNCLATLRRDIHHGSVRGRVDRV